MNRYIEVKVIPRAKRISVKEDNGLLQVYLTSPPVDDKANLQLMDVLSEYLDVPRRCIKIVRGHKNRTKLIEVLEI